MYAFFVDLQTWLAEWVEAYSSLITIILIVFFVLLPTIYLRIKFRAEFSKTSMFQPNIELIESSIIFLDTHRGAVYSYAVVVGLLFGLLYQEGSTSVYALLLLPGFSLVMVGVMFFSFRYQRYLIKLYKKRQAKKGIPHIANPKEVAEARQLQRLIEGYENEGQSEGNGPQKNSLVVGANRRSPVKTPNNNCHCRS